MFVNPAVTRKRIALATLIDVTELCAVSQKRCSASHPSRTLIICVRGKSTEIKLLKQKFCEIKGAVQ